MGYEQNAVFLLSSRHLLEPQGVTSQLLRPHISGLLMFTGPYILTDQFYRCCYYISHGLPFTNSHYRHKFYEYKLQSHINTLYTYNMAPHIAAVLTSAPWLDTINLYRNRKLSPPHYCLFTHE